MIVEINNDIFALSAFYQGSRRIVLSQGLFRTVKMGATGVVI